MSEISKIEWTDGTWNPVTGCTKVSIGCKNCYAETFAERFRGVPGHPYEQGFDLKLWPDRIELPLRWAKPRRIFVNSMSDLFHESIPDSFIIRVFETMFEANWHLFQLLTKRPHRLVEFIRQQHLGDLISGHPNIWLGTTVEHQDCVDRATFIAELPSVVRFLSCEPLLGPLDLRSVLGSASGINWVIVGGESGRRARPMKEHWVLDIQSQCQSAGVPFFFKQWGGKNKKKTGRLLENRTWDQQPVPSSWLSQDPIDAAV